MATILLVEYEGASLERRRGLSMAGHKVTSVRSFAEALGAIEFGKHDVVVLGHDLPQRERNRLAAAARRPVRRYGCWCCTATLSTMQSWRTH